MIWGISSPKQELIYQLEDHECPKCGDIGEVYLYGYTVYIHIFWIPTFSIGKRVKVICGNCDAKTKLKKMPQEVLDIVPEFKKEIKIPFTHFIGSVLLVLFIAFMVYILNQDEIDDTEKLQSPLIEDIYKIHELEAEEALYTSWKVVNVKADSVFVLVNEMKVESIWKLFTGLKKEENHRYQDDTIGYSINDLLTLESKDIIIGVNREGEE